jgi:hypothetical protein
MSYASKYLLLGTLITFLAPEALGNTRSYHTMTTGNGHHFSLFDRNSGRITEFLEHPYAFVASADDGGTYGIHRRNLAHDLYFGVQAPSGNVWLTDLENVEYLQETQIIRGEQNVGALKTQTYYFSPFELDANALVMALEVQNNSSNPMSVKVFAKPNLKLGEGRPYPNDWSETLTTAQHNSSSHMVETGSGGGHAFYLPLDSNTEFTCGEDSSLYWSMLNNTPSSQSNYCTGASQVPLFSKTITLAPGESKTWGLGVVFLNDTPNHPRAYSFRDNRTHTSLLNQWHAYIAGHDAQNLINLELSQFEEWRQEPPQDLTAAEVKLWRQSEAVLRMGLIEEKDSNDGMLLASLPPGDWHVGWVRDGAYAVVSLAMIGHHAEAKKGLDFFLGAEAGLYNRPEYYELQRPYRISVCRYFGNGVEESDWNFDGPNYETDGWGLILWAARQYLESSCDLDWLDSTTRQGDTVYEALLHIGEDIRSLIIDDLPAPDNSIWEVHWNHRQIFAYTVATQIRGLADLSAIMALKGDAALSQEFKNLANNMREKARTQLVHQPTQSIASHAGVASSYTHVDGSTVEFLNWSIYDNTTDIYSGTLEQYDVIRTQFGGYRRLDPELSLTGEAAATVYDTREWVMMDLRIGDAWLKSGTSFGAQQADQLLNTVTDLAAVNDNLIAELYDPSTGAYEGAIPMVGYGAGAWMMSKLLRLGQDVPPIHAGLEHCLAAENPSDEPTDVDDDVSDDTTTDDNEPEDAVDEPENNDDTETDGPTSGGGESSETETNPEPVNPNTPEPETPDESGGCHATPGTLYILPLIVGLLRRRK